MQQYGHATARSQSRRDTESQAVEPAPKQAQGPQGQNVTKSSSFQPQLHMELWGLCPGSLGWLGASRMSKVWGRDPGLTKTATMESSCVKLGPNIGRAFPALPEIRAFESSEGLKARPRQHRSRACAAEGLGHLRRCGARGCGDFRLWTLGRQARRVLVLRGVRPGTCRLCARAHTAHTALQWEVPSPKQAGELPLSAIWGSRATRPNGKGLDGCSKDSGHGHMDSCRTAFEMDFHGRCSA